MTKTTKIPDGFVKIATRKIYPVGGSNVIAVPTDLMQEKGVKAGDSVSIFKNADGQMLVVFK